MPRILTTMVLAGLLLAGCAPPGADLPEGSFERGEAAFEGDAYLSAIENLKLFIRRSPQDPRAPQAQFLVGRAYMETQDYPVAAVEFEILQVDYPQSELVDDAAYHEALCYVKQVPDRRLDQTVTEKAVERLRSYLRDHPQGTHHEEARARLDALVAQLDRKHLDAARYYRRRGHLEPAKQVADNILVENPESPLRPEILLFRAEVLLEMEDYEAAERDLQEVARRWPEHELAGRAESLLARAEKGQAGS